MRAVVQRVKRASVTVGAEITGEIGKGLLVLLGVSVRDSEKDAAYLADKTLNLRVFEDAEDKMNLSLLDIKGELLVVSQFTLYGDTSGGRRPRPPSPPAASRARARRGPASSPRAQFARQNALRDIRRSVGRTDDGRP